MKLIVDNELRNFKKIMNPETRSKVIYVSKIVDHA